MLDGQYTRRMGEGRRCLQPPSIIVAGEGNFQQILNKPFQAN